MKVTENDVVYVAGLANLELTEAERLRMVKDLNSILDYMERLGQLDTTNVEPMAQTSDRYGVNQAKHGSARFAYVLREDVVGPSLPHQEAVRNAPDTDDTFFKVPKVIER